MKNETRNTLLRLSKPRTPPSIATFPKETSSTDRRRINMVKTIGCTSNILPQSSCYKQLDDQDEDYKVLQWNHPSSKIRKRSEECPSDTSCPPDTPALKKRLRATTKHISALSTNLPPGISRHFACGDDQGKEKHLLTQSAQMAFQAIIIKIITHISIRRFRVLSDTFAFSPPILHITQ